MLTNGAYGWVVPHAPYMYEPPRFPCAGRLAGLAGAIVLAATALRWGVHRVLR